MPLEAFLDGCSFRGIGEHGGRNAALLITTRQGWAPTGLEEARPQGPEVDVKHSGLVIAQSDLLKEGEDTFSQDA